MYICICVICNEVKGLDAIMGEEMELVNLSAVRLQSSSRAAAVQQNDQMRSSWTTGALVTGGLGGLGLVAAQELLEVGANRRNRQVRCIF